MKLVDWLLLVKSDQFQNINGNYKKFRIKNKIYLKYQFHFDRFPEPIARVKNSAFILSQQIFNYTKPDRKEYVKSVIRNGLGIEDSDEYEINYLNETHSRAEYELFLANMTSFRARLGVNYFNNAKCLLIFFFQYIAKVLFFQWTTLGHTAIDVNLYAYGQDTDVLHGNHENTDIGDFIVKYLNLDLEFITRKLRYELNIFFNT